MNQSEGNFENQLQNLFDSTTKQLRGNFHFKETIQNLGEPNMDGTPVQIEESNALTQKASNAPRWLWTAVVLLLVVATASITILVQNDFTRDNQNGSSNAAGIGSGNPEEGSGVLPGTGGLTYEECTEVVEGVREGGFGECFDALVEVDGEVSFDECEGVVEGGSGVPGWQVRYCMMALEAESEEMASDS